MFVVHLLRGKGIVVTQFFRLETKLLPVRELCLQSVYLSLSSLFRIMPLTFYSTIFLYRVQVVTDGSYK